MIKITVIAVGSLKEKYLKEAVSEYLKRLSAFAKVTVTEINECRSSSDPSDAEIEAVKKKEGDAILSKIPKSAYVIPMCIEGTQLSSEEISSKIEEIAVRGTPEIVFIIGGSFGLSEEVKKAGQFRLSFGKITLPHQLMRVLLLEQIYRALSISNHSKYHK